MRKSARGLWLVILPLCLALWARGAAAQTETEGIVYVPGHPQTMWVPDPDAVQWDGRGDRPGYRYRGMAPIQQRFYDYIMAKRQAGTPLSWSERATIAQLQSIRRWPEAPVPDDFWRSYMRYLRDLEREELTFTETLMAAQLISRGYLPSDRAPTGGAQRLIDFVQASGARTPRNWFESTFGRVNDWMNHSLASCGYDMTGGGGAGDGVFPGEPFNGMQIRYALGGATLGPPSDSPGFTTSRSYEGVLTPGARLTLTGSVSQRNGYGASVSVSLSAGAVSDQATLSLTTPGNGSAAVKEFSLAVDVPADAETGRFSVDMTGSYNAGDRGLTVGGSLRISDAEHAARQAAADAKWREEVERTLRELGYKNTPEGEAIAAMRAALAGGDAAWQAYVDAQLAALAGATDPETASFTQLADALQAGGAAWDQYAAANGGAAPGGTPPGDAPKAEATGDVGGLQVGTGAADGAVQGAGDRFGPTPSVSTLVSYEDLPAGTPCEVVWTRDGVEVVRRARQVGGSGWISFQIGGAGGNLAPGKYVVTITIGGKVVGRKSFTIGG